MPKIPTPPEWLQKWPATIVGLLSAVAAVWAVVAIVWTHTTGQVPVSLRLLLLLAACILSLIVWLSWRLINRDKTIRELKDAHAKEIAVLQQERDTLANQLQQQPKKLKPRFGFLWDADLQAHCPACNSPISWGNYEVSGWAFYCTKCKHYLSLADDVGKPILIAEARKQLSETK